MLMAGWLDGLDATGRWALLKLAAGALRVGVSARLAKTALSAIGTVSLEEIEELWPQHEPPYLDLIRWVTGGEKPAPRNTLGFRPLMLSQQTKIMKCAPFFVERLKMMLAAAT